QAGGRVRDEDEVPGLGADVLRKRRLRRLDELLVLAPEKPRRLPLEPQLPALVVLEDGARTGAERAVVEVDDIRLEQEELAQRGYAFPTRSSPPRASTCTASVSVLIQGS